MNIEMSFGMFVLYTGILMYITFLIYFWFDENSNFEETKKWNSEYECPKWGYVLVRIEYKNSYNYEIAKASKIGDLIFWEDQKGDHLKHVTGWIKLPVNLKQGC